MPAIDLKVIRNSDYELESFREYMPDALEYIKWL
jgi:hypothetical protein